MSIEVSAAQLAGTIRHRLTDERALEKVHVRRNTEITRLLFVNINNALMISLLSLYSLQCSPQPPSSPRPGKQHTHASLSRFDGILSS